MYRSLFFFIIFLIFKKDLSVLKALESLVFTAITVLINQRCIYKYIASSQDKINVLNTSIFVINLFKDIIISSWQVSKFIIFRKHFNSIAPIVRKIQTKSLKNTRIAILANSITMTPGTMSFNVKKDEIYIHALKEDFIKELECSELLHYIKYI
jgi:multicomponent Na+:H+ antiporter subunit E